MTTAEAAHEFGALNTLLLVVVLGLCIMAAYLIKQNSFYYLPESAAAIVVGIIVGGLAKLVYPSSEELKFLSFESEIFFFLLLPPIIFEAGYSLEKKDFLDNFWSITLYAVFGTIISTFIVGYLVYGIGVAKIIDIDTSSPMEALVYGSLISAVDPVATLSIMGNPELNCDALLYALVFGESVLNDAVAIVLFKTFMTFYESGQEFSSNTIPIILINFTYISIGSFFIGILTGLACSYLCKQTYLHLYPEYEICILFLFAYGSYSFSESLGLSGIMSLFFCGMTLSQYNNYNLSPTSQITAHTIFKSLAILCEYIVFLYMGMQVFTGTFYVHVHWGFFWLMFFFCVIGRFFNIFPLTLIANLLRTQKISIPMQMVMWFSGLRGAIAFALAQGMPIEHRGIYVSTTLMLVVFTTIGFGGLTEPMLSLMGMRLPPNTTNTSSTTSSSGTSPTNSATGMLTPTTPTSILRATSNKNSLDDLRKLDPIPTSSSSTIQMTPMGRTLPNDDHPFGLHNRSGKMINYERVLTSDMINDLETNGSNHSSINGGILTTSSKKTIFEHIDDEYMKPMFGGPSLEELMDAEEEARIPINGGSSLER